MKIAMEMSKVAYEVARKVYYYFFLAMMNGEAYKRTFNNDTNNYLFVKIRQDYGESKSFKCRSKNT